MSKIRKSFLKGSAMMLSLAAAMALSSGVAYAQECFAYQNSPSDARAGGVTELMGGIELQCRGRQGFGLPSLNEEVTISITLNTQITNEPDEDGVPMGLTYTGGSPNALPVTDDVWKGDDKQVLSDGGTTISWTIDTSGTDGDELNPPNTEAGASVIIGGILADASSVGDGEDVTAEVRVNGQMINFSPVKLADVMTGLEIEVTAASGLQCAVPSGTSAVATILFKEGFNRAIMAAQAADVDTTPIDETREARLVLNLSGVPDDVKVTASMAGTGMPLAMPGDGTDLAPLELQMGDDEGADADGVVSISNGMGEIVYEFASEDHDPDGDGTLTTVVGLQDDLEEWNTVTLTFEWEANAPGLGTASIMVGFAPVGGDDDDIPRYVAGAAMDLLEVEDCDTSMLFPFVTNMHGFDTGVALTNTSDVDGSCMVEYSGTGAPMDDGMVMVGAGSTTTFGLSMMAPGFQGYIDVTCDYRNAKGLAFITNGAGSPGGPSLAHGYVVGEDLEQSD